MESGGGGIAGFRVRRRDDTDNLGLLLEVDRVLFDDDSVLTTLVAMAVTIFSSASSRSRSSIFLRAASLSDFAIGMFNEHNTKEGIEMGAPTKGEGMGIAVSMPPFVLGLGGGNNLTSHTGICQNDRRSSGEC